MSASPQFPANPAGLKAALAWAAEKNNEVPSTAADVDRVILRPAVAADAPIILGLVKELADFEREPEAVVTTVDTFLRDGFSDAPGATPLFHVLLASLGADSTVVAMAFVYQSYSTWTGPCMYLEDLYVTPSARRKRVSRTLFRALARAAWATGSARLHWSVLKWNTPALGLCACMRRAGVNPSPLLPRAVSFVDESPEVGAERLEEWASYRLNRPDIARVAELSSFLSEAPTTSPRASDAV